MTRMVRIVVRDTDHVRCVTIARELADHLRNREPTVRVRGPAPCPIARIADRHRQQVEMFAETPGPLHRLLSLARSEEWLRPGAEMAVDVDPIALL